MPGCQNHLLPANQGAIPNFPRLMLHFAHNVVVVVRIVMKDGELFDAGHLTKTNSFLPCGVTPPDFCREFFIVIG